MNEELKIVEQPKRRGRPPGTPGPAPQRTEKEIYDRTLNQVWGVLVSRKTDPEMRARYHFAILRWQGKLDAVDDKNLDELKKLLGKKAS